MKTIQKFVLAVALIATLSIGALSAADAFSRRSSDEALLTRSHDTSSIVLMKQKMSNNEYEGQH